MNNHLKPGLTNRLETTEKAETTSTIEGPQTWIVYLTVALVLIVTNFYLGDKTAWWTFIIPAFLVGWFVRGKTIRLVASCAAAAWLGRALYFDYPTGFRLSMRIAGVMSVPGGSFSAYLVMCLLVAILAALAGAAGSSLRSGLFSRLGS